MKIGEIEMKFSDKQIEVIYENKCTHHNLAFWKDKKLKEFINYITHKDLEI